MENHNKEKLQHDLSNKSETEEAHRPNLIK